MVKNNNNDWTWIDSKFADKPWYRVEQTYQQLWISQELTPAQAQSALSQGFTLDDFMFLVWLRDNKGLKIEQIKTSAIKILRKKYQAVWTQLDSQFTRKAEDGKTYQQIWESHGLNYHQASVWVKLSGVGDNYCWPWEWMQRGFDPAAASAWMASGFDWDDARSAGEWKNCNFTLEQVQTWLAKGLKENRAELAAYARWKGYQPSQINLTEYKSWQKQPPAQEWLDCFYPAEVRNTITNLAISNINLTGELDLSDLVNLTRLSCPHNQLTSLNLANCHQLKTFRGWKNHLTDLVLTNSVSKQLTFLDLRSNNFSTQDLSLFSHLVNCETLDISNNPWTGSLAPLKHSTKLKELNISQTNIDSGLEYLPTSLEKFYCQNTPLKRELKNYNGDWKLAREFLKKEQQIISLKTEQTKFAQQKDTIDYLQARIAELLTLNKQKSERIFQALSRLLPEKELLRELIQTHLALVRYKSQATAAIDYDEIIDEYEERTRTIKQQLRKKLDKEQMNKIRGVLNDFEKLIEQELELEAKLQQKQILIDSHQLTDNTPENQKRKRIVDLEEQVQQEQQQQFKRLCSKSLLAEIEKAKEKSVKDDGKIEILKELAILPRYAGKYAGCNNFSGEQIQGINAEGNVSVEGGFAVEGKIEVGVSKFSL
jgi:hypothetical protein